MGLHMTGLKRFVLLTAASLALALTAHAQPGLSTKPNYDGIYNAERIDESTQRDLAALHKTATDALAAQNYVGAETALADLVRRNPTTVDSSFLMGLAKIGLGQWEDARRHLEAAVKKEPRRPEPKARLGLVYTMLDNPDAARRQRADLASLDTACKSTCADATWIAEGLAAIDYALANPGAGIAAASPVIAPTASVTTSVASVTGFDTTKYSLVVFGDTADLYDALTRDGRCAAKAPGTPREPCALILYRPLVEEPGGTNANFRPVFRVESSNAIWATLNGKLQKVKIEDLFTDTADTFEAKGVKFRATALVGNAENRANCATGLPCLDALGSQDMFRMYQSMPDNVVKAIWGGK